MAASLLGKVPALGQQCGRLGALRPHLDAFVQHYAGFNCLKLHTAAASCSVYTDSHLDALGQFKVWRYNLMYSLEFYLLQDLRILDLYFGPKL